MSVPHTDEKGRTASVGSLPTGSRHFPMLDGPPIDLERAKEVYRLYTCLFGSQQSLARIAERGGFGHEEIFYIEKKHAAEKARGRCTCANTGYEPRDCGEKSKP